MQAAKEKAIYLAKAVGERPGEAITINEPNEWQPFSIYENEFSNARYNTYAANDSISAPQPQVVDFKKLKLKFDGSVVFALK